MTPKEFIKKEMENFIEQFPQVRARYEFHELSCAHFIEIVPREVYSCDEKYISWEAEMLDKFVELYPEEGICFISDDALVGIENSELTLRGAGYARSKSQVAQRPAPARRKPKAQTVEYA
ncbi:MAG: hypothetical protein LBK18_08080 [Prevotellaceae bacterium]|jgi:hypothetical protein|nr:hypothetical protein [Prevotellaceae bacterium]